MDVVACYKGRGLCYTKLEQPKQAYEAYNEALKLGRGTTAEPELWRARGMRQLELGNTAEARQDLLRAAVLGGE